jgi:hypothetical protein
LWFAQLSKNLDYTRRLSCQLFYLPEFPSLPSVRYANKMREITIDEPSPTFAGVVAGLSKSAARFMVDYMRHIR